MKEKIVVITGASSGFGLLTSIEFAKSGYYVIATMRNRNKSNELLEKAKEMNVVQNIEVMELDVTSEESLRAFASKLEKMENVDVLVNNAGYAYAGFIEEVPLLEYRKQFETNVFGLIAVTQTIIPMMRKNKNGTIINISSISGRIGFPALSPYVASKHAIEGFTESLRLEMKPFGVNVVLIEPGSYKTNIWSRGKKVMKTSFKEESPYHHYLKKIEHYLKKNERGYGDPQEVAIKIKQIADKKHPLLRYPIGKRVKTMIFIKNIIGWKNWEKILNKQLYK